MTGDCHVRFCERLGAKLPRPTDLLEGRIWILLACLILAAGWAAADAAGAPPNRPFLLRDPSLGRTQIAFDYGGNVWIAKRDGSRVRRLTRGGKERKPVLSPDESQVAFVGEYDGTRAVYLVSSNGGEPARLTYHPDDLALDWLADDNELGWTPDGKRIYFNSRRESFAWHRGQPFSMKLFTVPVSGGPVTALPLGQAAQAGFSPDGSRVAFVPIARWQNDWKGYRGGQTTPIWIAGLNDSSIIARIPRDNSNDFNPMWVGDTIYFLSDRDGATNLFAYDIESGQVHRIRRNDGMDIRSASATADAIAYEKFGSLHILDLRSGADAILDIRPVADFPEVKSHLLQLQPSEIQYADISPNGALATLGVRGEIFSASTADMRVQNITRTPGVVERDPAWSPDGKSVAYFSDESGEYSLHVRDMGNSLATRKISLGATPGFPYSPTWSPDSKHIGYTDQRLNYWYVDLDTKRVVHIDRDLYVDPVNGLEMTWSADGHWIAYTKQLPSHFHAIFIYSVATAQAYQLTDESIDALHAGFDANDDALYFTGCTDCGKSAAWLDMSSLEYRPKRKVYSFRLQGLRQLPAGATRVGRTPASVVVVPREVLKRNIAVLEIPARNYSALTVSSLRQLFVVEESEPSEESGGGGDTVERVYQVDLKSGAAVRVLDGITAFPRVFKSRTSFHLAADGRHMLYAKRGQWFVGEIRSPEVSSRDPGEKQLSLGAASLLIEPRAQWRHMYHQVWRNEREFFYDPGLHGLNLEETERRYEPFLTHIVTRDDLNCLFNEMLGNLTVSHMTAYGGDGAVHERSKTGLLGADFAVAHGLFYISRIYSGDPWNADLRGPLGEASAFVKPGEYLLSVGGQEVRATRDIYSFFAGTVGKNLVLTVGPNADGTQSRQIRVSPIADETALRRSEWVASNRKRVNDLTGGRVAYVHVPDTFKGGLQTFNREYFSQVGKDAAIIDERYNDGGLGADSIVDSMRRPLMSYWATRSGTATTSPQEAIFGPKVMLINEMAGSGGDFLAWMFRRSSLGPLIGKRTWGGLVGQYVFPDDLLDGGIVWTPNLAFFSPAGYWEIENHGIDPDIEVDSVPDGRLDGGDPQLDKAIETVMSLLKAASEPSHVEHPPYPNHLNSDFR